ncbi:MAG: TolC family protein [Verrucomicrobia bacterium]|nr:TolC family protein [Verrucomicrobiota bacterium]
MNNRSTPFPKGALAATRFLAALSIVLFVVGKIHAAESWTLARAISHALTNSPDARIAQKRIAAARAGIAQANSALWPQLQLQSSYTRTDNPMFVFGSILNQRAFSPSLNFNDVPDVDNLNVRGVLTMPLYAGGRISAGRNAAKANTGAAKANAEAVRNTLAFEVARTFHTVLKTREFIRAAEAGVRSFENNLTIASNRVNTGTALKTDMLDMQVRLAQAREDLVRDRNANALSERALRTVLGIEAGEFAVASSAPEVAPPVEDLKSEISNLKFPARPELAAVQEGQRAAEAQVRQAKSGYRPRVSAFGSLDYDQGWVSDGDGNSYTAGVMVQWNLWDGKLTRGRVSEAQANLEAAREEERKLRLAIGFEVEQARLQLKEASERLAVTEAAVAQAQESVELTRSRFEQGLMISTQLIDADTALLAARVRRAEAEGDQRIAIAALRKALGLPQLNSAP